MLRGLFGISALLMGLMGAVVNAQETEEQAIEALTGLGGSIRVVAADSEEKEAAFHLSGTELTDEGLVHLPKLNQLIWLNLRGTKITDGGLQQVGQCKTLSRIHLEKTGVTDVGLAHLKDLPALVYLNLYGTQVSDAGLEHLKGLSSLKKLYVWQTQVTPEGAAKLKEALPELEVVLGGELNKPAPEETEGEAAKEEDADSEEKKPEEKKPEEKDGDK